jgi:hypothetical protein
VDAGDRHQRLSLPRTEYKELSVEVETQTIEAELNDHSIIQNHHNAATPTATETLDLTQGEDETMVVVADTNGIESHKLTMDTME